MQVKYYYQGAFSSPEPLVENKDARAPGDENDQRALLPLVLIFGHKMMLSKV